MPDTYTTLPIDTALEIYQCVVITEVRKIKKTYDTERAGALMAKARRDMVSDLNIVTCAREVYDCDG